MNLLINPVQYFKDQTHSIMFLQYHGVDVEGCVGGCGGSWDCAGQRRVTEQHTENGSIVPLFTLLDSSNARLPFANSLRNLSGVYLNPDYPDLEELSLENIYWTC